MRVTVHTMMAGVLRDVLAGERPYVFVKHFYACASLFGALAIVILKNYISLFPLGTSETQAEVY